MKRLAAPLILLSSLGLAQNPVVRQSRVVLFTTTAATGTATSSAILLPNNSGYGSLEIVGSGITGSPSGCQITLAYQESLGGATGTVWATQAFTPASSNQQFNIIPSSAVYATGDSMVAVYTCSGYPGAGTISVTWAGNMPVSVLGTVPVSAASLPLPTGAATSAAQTTAQTSLSSIDTKTPSLGQALAAASVPVILPSATVTALTPPAAIAGFALDATLTGGTQKTKIVDSGGTNVATVSAGGAVKTDASATTQPVSATSLPLPAGASTAAKQPAPGTAGSASSDVITIQGAASMTKLLVTPDSVALPSNQSVNESQINGVTPLMGNGTSGTGAQRVAIASDNTAVAAAGQGATGSAVPAGATQFGVTDGTNLRAPYMDPCGWSAWTYYVVNVSSNTQIVAGASSKKVYVCEILFPPQAGITNVNLVESATSGNACATSPTGMLGGATAALGANITANGGWVVNGQPGRALAVTATAADAMCIFASASVNGVIAYVQN
jgi:hypothetical protein